MSTKIRWTDETWNPTTGCSVVSPGCERCYAATMSLRFGWSKKPWTAQNAKENVILHPERLRKPYTWKKPSRVFVDSMADLFHELVPFEYVDRVFEVIQALPQHTFQILTKRPARQRDYMRWRFGNLDNPPANVWCGTSVEDQRRANERLPLLIDTPAAVRFLSCEPLLGHVDLSDWLLSTRHIRANEDEDVEVESQPPRFIDWVIVGGESGPVRRG